MKKVKITASDSFGALFKKGEASAITQKLNLKSELTAPVKKDDVVYLTPEVVLDGDKNVRTHKIVKVEKGLLSYAQDILVKYGLTKEDLLRRRKVNEK